MKNQNLTNKLSIAIIIAITLFSSNMFAQIINPNGIEIPAACTNCSGTTVYSGKVASTLGIGTEASDSAAFASGFYSAASGKFSTALGYRSIASGDYSFASGYRAEATYDYSVSIGKYVKTSANNAFVIGNGDVVGLGYLNDTIASSMMFGLGSTKPTMTIRGATSQTGTGKVGIATTSPDTDLHVNGTIKTNNFIMTAGKYDGYILTSDTAGNASWEDPNLLTNWKLNSSSKMVTEYGGGFDIDTGDDVYGSFQIGKEFTFYGSGIGDNKMIANNYKWVNTDDAKRINTGFASMIKLEGGSGKVIINAAGSDTTINNIAWESMVFTPDGNLGIGTTAPDYKLHIESSSEIKTNIHASNAVKSIYWSSNSLGSYGFGIDESGKGRIYSNINGYDNIISFTNNGKVLIGEDTDLDGTHKLYVNGSIMTTEVNVAEVNNWSDFVFDKGYELLTLQEVENFIKQNGHLPDVPSEQEVKDQGVNLVETDAILLQKIEELTLYMIQQQKLVQKQQQEIDALKEIVKNN